MIRNKNILSFLYLFLFSIGFLVCEVVAAFLIGLAVAVYAFLSGHLILGLGYVFAIPFIASIFVIFPITWVISYIVFNRATTSLHVPRPHKIIVIVVSGIILSFIVTWIPLYVKYNAYKTNRRLEKLNSISALIVSEKVSRDPKPEFGVSDFIYDYTYVLNNSSNEDMTISAIQIDPGIDEKNGRNILYSDANYVYQKNLKPGKNVISGRLKVAHEYGVMGYPVSGFVPIRLKLNLNEAEKSIYIYSSSPEWKKVF